MRILKVKVDTLDIVNGLYGKELVTSYGGYDVMTSMESSSGDKFRNKASMNWD